MTSSRNRQPASPAWGRGRELITEAAVELFSQRAYSAVSTRELAARAGVTEAMIFRHFGSKARLFETAVLTPFIEHLNAYLADWEDRPHHVLEPMEEARDFYCGAYRVFSANKHLVRALVEAGSGEGTRIVSESFARALAPVFDRFASVIEAERDARGFRRFDPALTARLMLGLAASQVAFGEWTYVGSAHEPPTEDEIIEEMALFTIFGAWSPGPRQ